MTASATLKVFDIQGFSVHDGPGIRQTIFLKGCPLRCRWCHSPESQHFQTEILWLGIKCTGCLRCVDACPNGARTAIMPEQPGGKIKIVCNWDLCTTCGACEQVCLSGALYYCGVDQPAEDLMARILREKPFYDKSGGGITVSGGECLCQPDGVAALLKLCKLAGVNTAVDTCGFINYENIKKVLPVTDLFLYDIKHMNSDEHKWGTGVANELILENARKIASDGGKLHVRIPLMPGYNTDDENILATRDFCLEIKEAVQLVQLLPFHNLGSAKYERLSTAAPELQTQAPDEELVGRISEMFTCAGFKVVVH